MQEPGVDVILISESYKSEVGHKILAPPEGIFGRAKVTGHHKDSRTLIVQVKENAEAHRVTRSMKNMDFCILNRIIALRASDNPEP